MKADLLEEFEKNKLEAEVSFTVQYWSYFDEMRIN
jgi:hypothetical protein